MTQAQIKTFNDLIKDSTFVGKKQLRHLLWLNTAKPKYNEGECFLVSDLSRKIYGQRVVNFHAKIVRTYTWRDEDEFYYELEMACEKDGKPYVTSTHQPESRLDASTRCTDNLNVLDAVAK